MLITSQQSETINKMKEINENNQPAERVSQVESPIQTIKKQLANSYDGTPWYGPAIKEVLEIIDPDYAFESPEKNMQSIGEIIAHMLSCRKFAEQRLAGNLDYTFQEEEFDWRELSTNKKEAWNILMGRFQVSQETLIQLMNQNNDIELGKRVNGKTYTFRNMLAGILQHDIHHLGQVEYIHNLLSKNKKPATRMLRYSFRVFPFESLAQQK